MTPSHRSLQESEPPTAAKLTGGFRYSRGSVTHSGRFHGSFKVPRLHVLTSSVPLNAGIGKWGKLTRYAALARGKFRVAG